MKSLCKLHYALRHNVLDLSHNQNYEFSFKPINPFKLAIQMESCLFVYLDNEFYEKYYSSKDDLQVQNDLTLN